MIRARIAAAIVLGAVLAPALAACSSGSSLPEPPACESPTPTPTPRQGTGEFRYIAVMRSGTQALHSLTNDWRLEWEDGKMSSRPEFREQFVVYAAKSRCLAQDMLATNPPGGRFSAEEEQFEAALTQFTAAMDFGMAAVQSRNVSEYRDFYKRVDGAFQRLDELVLDLPSGR
ncbi:MAG: hypothetical protein IT303_15965 [Dehalococcoidia bacterium]|nr:hypothetical protein [Dehalococcoidia bacterium]